ncbi:MAG: hypothetical protein CSA62_07540 [Planctomycetota bacterium]|nr:MAG: hypothetical protein CSA62_07540 [Planctomycetota bacterium]
MILHYCRFSDLPAVAADSNVGDDLNAILWPNFIGDCLDGDSQWWVSGIGTILDSIPAQQPAVILGSGYRHGQGLVDTSRWVIYFVRGRKTAEALGLDHNKAITDPALLTPDLVPRARKSYGQVALVPHVTTSVIMGTSLKRSCEYSGIRYVDPRLAPSEFVAELTACDWVLSEAMHGAILADSYGIPWVPLVSGKHIDRWKWADWAETMHLDLAFRRIRSLAASRRRFLGEKLGDSLGVYLMAAQLKYLLRTAKPRCSCEKLRAVRREQLLEAIQRFMSDWRRGRFG